MACLKKFIGLILLLTLIPCVSATITLTEPDNSYNLGGNLNLEFSVLKSKAMNAFIELTLNCEDGSKQLLLTPVSLKADKEEESDYSIPLTESFVDSNDLIGDCVIEIILEDMEMNKIDEAVSKTFIISNELDLSVNLLKTEFLPGEKIDIEGTAYLKNGKETDAKAIINFGTEFNIDVEDSKFDLGLILKEDIKSGSHTILISVSDNYGNSAEVEKQITIIPILTSIMLETNQDFFMPEDELIVEAIFADQAADEMESEGRLSVVLDDKEILNKEIVSDEEVKYTFDKYASPGDIEIKVISEDVERTETAEMQRFERIDIDLRETLDATYFDITNLGNVPYKKELIIQFNTDTGTIEKTKTVSLGVGEKTSFSMTAPSGTYDVIVKNEDIEKSFNGVSLTGESIKVIDITGRERKAFIRNIAIAAFLGAIMLVFIAKRIREFRYRQRMKNRKMNDESVRKYVSKLKDEHLVPEDLDYARLEKDNGIRGY